MSAAHERASASRSASVVVMLHRSPSAPIFEKSHQFHFFRCRRSSHVSSPNPGLAVAAWAWMSARAWLCSHRVPGPSYGYLAGFPRCPKQMVRMRVLAASRSVLHVCTSLTAVGTSCLPSASERRRTWPMAESSMVRRRGGAIVLVFLRLLAPLSSRF